MIGLLENFKDDFNILNLLLSGIAIFRIYEKIDYIYT